MCLCFGEIAESNVLVLSPYHAILMGIGNGVRSIASQANKSCSTEQPTIAVALLDWRPGPKRPADPYALLQNRVLHISSQTR